MRLHPLALFVLTFGLTSPASTPAQDSPPRLPGAAPAARLTPTEVIDFDSWQEMLGLIERAKQAVVRLPSSPEVQFQPDLVRTLDTRSRADYGAGHLPGAVWVDVKKAQEIAARPGGLTDRDAWVEWLTPLGIKDRDMVVVVVDGDRQLDAARVRWLLRYLGVDMVALLNGNFGLWQTQRRPVTVEVPDVAPNPYPVQFQSDRLATRDDVQQSLKAQSARIVDARTAEEWAGQKLLSKRGGHIPSACRLEWTEFVDKQGRFLPKDQLQAKVAAAGIKPGEPIIAHCQGGGRAAVDAFVFEMLGHPTRNYYLSWADWGNADDTAITTDETPQPPAALPPGPRLNDGVEYLPPAETKSIGVPIEARPFTVEYDYKAKWGHADEFLTLFKKNHLPVLREREKAGDILSIKVVKPRIHTGEADRWDFRVTLVFKDAAEAFNIAADEPIKQRLFPDQAAYKAEEQRRFAILEGHTDLPIEAVPLD